jgi:hypothetical protein
MSFSSGSFNGLGRRRVYGDPGRLQPDIRVMVQGIAQHIANGFDHFIGGYGNPNCLSWIFVFRLEFQRARPGSTPSGTGSERGQQRRIAAIYSAGGKT